MLGLCGRERRILERTLDISYTYLLSAVTLRATRPNVLNTPWFSWEHAWQMHARNVFADKQRSVECDFSSPIIISVPSMDIPTYPGKGLSLSQLVFALNEELKHATNSSLCVMSHCSGLIESDALTIPAASPQMGFVNSSGTFRTRFQSSASGRTPSSPSTVFRWKSFHSFQPTSPPKGIVST